MLLNGVFRSHGKREVAWSSNVTVKLEILTLSPQSDKRTNLLLVSGETRSIDTSPTEVCEKPFNLTLMSATVPDKPETVTSEG